MNENAKPAFPKDAIWMEITKSSTLKDIIDGQV